MILHLFHEFLKGSIFVRTVSVSHRSFPGLLSFHDHSTAFLNSYSSAIRSRANLRDHRKIDEQIVRGCVEDYVNSFQRRYRLANSRVATTFFSLFSFLLLRHLVGSIYKNRLPYPMLINTFSCFRNVSACEQQLEQCVRVCGIRLATERIERQFCGSPIARFAKILLLPVYTRRSSANNKFPGRCTEGASHPPSATVWQGTIKTRVFREYWNVMEEMGEGTCKRSLTALSASRRMRMAPVDFVERNVRIGETS